MSIDNEGVDESTPPTPDVGAMSDEELIAAPAKGIQPGAAGAEADARHGLPTGTTVPPSGDALAEKVAAETDPGVLASQVDPDTEVEAYASDLKPETPIVDTK